MVYYYIIDRGAPPISVGPNEFAVQDCRANILTTSLRFTF
jgi:hypothetical protein